MADGRQKKHVQEHYTEAVTLERLVELAKATPASPYVLRCGPKRAVVVVKNGAIDAAKEMPLWQCILEQKSGTWGFKVNAADNYSFEKAKDEEIEEKGRGASAMKACINTARRCRKQVPIWNL
jgi:hypothetical protein